MARKKTGKIVGAFDAKTRLRELLDRYERGESMSRSPLVLVSTGGSYHPTPSGAR